MLSATTELLISEALRSPYRSMEELDALIALMPPDPDDEPKSDLPRPDICQCGNAIQKPRAGCMPTLCRSCRARERKKYLADYRATHQVDRREYQNNRNRAAARGRLMRGEI